MTEVGDAHGSGRTSSNFFERVFCGEGCLADVIRCSFLPNKTTFLTPLEFKQQVGYVCLCGGR